MKVVFLPTKIIDLSRNEGNFPCYEKYTMIEEVFIPSE